MKIGILCAGEKELAPFLTVMEESKTSEKAMLKFYEGSVAGVEIAAVSSGGCKVNAAIAAQILIDRYQVDTVINAGTGGGMDSELDIFDTVISTDAVYYDVAPKILTESHPRMETACFPADEELLRLSKAAVGKLRLQQRVYWGRMATGEAFIGDEGREKIREDYAPLSVDMETASVAHVCYVNKRRFIAVRTITDTAIHSGDGHFRKNCREASAIARDIAVALIKELKPSADF